MVCDQNPVPVVHFQQSEISFYEDSKIIDRGTLKITESSFLWEGVSCQFSIPYSQITLHAIARNTVDSAGDQSTQGSFPYAHLLVMVDGDRVWVPQHLNNGTVDKNEENEMMVDAIGSEDQGVQEDGSESDRASDCPGATYILRFVPALDSTLEEMYKALADCQALNPDPEDAADSNLEDLAESVEDEDLYTREDNNDEEFDTEQFADA